MDLAGKHIVLGLTGGIAGYKAAELTRALIKAGATVQVVMTDAATHFITPVTMQALSGKTVYTDQWDARIANNMAHIDLTRHADALIIAPCSADFIAKLAQGRCDDLLSTLCVARPATLPLLIAPAMNIEMWQNAATQRNVQQLVLDGVQVLGPDAGDQACGETGMGRMLEPMQLLDDVIAAFQPKVLLGKRVLITAGPTFEPIDPVRGITNLSSGKMGYALARAAREAGADVTLVSGPTALATPTGVQRINVHTAQQMFDIVLSHVSGQDVFIAVAAVADWRVVNASEQKLKKSAGSALPQLEFALNPDILATVAALPDKPYCVGFAAESEQLLKHGKAKRDRKGIPLLVGNIGHTTFGKDDNELVLFDANTEIHFPRAAKQQLARQLITEISERLLTHIY
ncbi:bifunctional phosphopantothenoylcysteine decarboxylase/phosphopantothenate--cysteine ligase CoaBC [Actimicrobium sp. CCC2.4]|uniref:bifunctional phosphopantothenoylcysteine decarboxylase/phosphopantothenate--cysteine ligase CoaBC n=1 Tax=Actimicrobium sp. CCC2.4 TaxID=3048606 RepID=UPI002AC8E1A8|nr:bifunctional phosphopantothenoylcysteine decarboxylase/phosphopantothenate--cysteine ligase CoaBC [Actimicrobium sp. CCC2.4]MEB0135002.1 bifunctional phosphopantothenoylcysteine decarboxylase/phosphopantothenate--cysteine ligase CoaBC [Actimicrobium sp. CCC2.4]WPX31950.1 bifunctional phosphopantothenoylcysteine decarboxylase/phosphopantothenate--cysteine ligase CoaBC [Actimicrobium sp. CCC2.4]